MRAVKQPKRRRFLAWTVIFLVGIIGTFLLITNRQYITDQVGVWSYQPTSEIERFATRAGMNDTGKFYFYASRPSLESADSFNRECARREQAVAVLGCYNGVSIYIYDIQDATLDGIREVTAAHEMLHAAYARLSSSDRRKVDELLEAEYTLLRQDTTFADRMAFYDRSEPGERYNELHSIIGTEVATLQPELEMYYDRYFGDRHSTVALYAAYSGVFLEVQQHADALSAQLTQLGDTIEQETAAYNSDTAQFNADATAFQRRVEAGGFADQATYDSERGLLVARAELLDSQRTTINAMVEHYESLRAELHEVAQQSEALNRSIDSSLTAAPTL
jgi:hypothetical protein